MLVASDNINSVGPFEWAKEGDKGAIELPDALAYELISRKGGHYWAVDGTKAPEKAPKAEPKVELQEDEESGDELADAIDAAAVTPKKAPRGRKPASKE